MSKRRNRVADNLRNDLHAQRQIAQPRDRSRGRDRGDAKLPLLKLQFTLALHLEKLEPGRLAQQTLDERGEEEQQDRGRADDRDNRFHPMTGRGGAFAGSTRIEPVCRLSSACGASRSAASNARSISLAGLVGTTYSGRDLARIVVLAATAGAGVGIG